MSPSPCASEHNICQCQKKTRTIGIHRTFSLSLSSPVSVDGHNEQKWMRKLWSAYWLIDSWRISLLFPLFHVPVEKLVFIGYFLWINFCKIRKTSNCKKVFVEFKNLGKNAFFSQIKKLKNVFFNICSCFFNKLPLSSFIGLITNFFS